MRKKSVFKEIKFGQTMIEDIQLDYNCRDSIIPVLRSLKEIYLNDCLCEKIIDLIGVDISHKDISKGRIGLSAWQIFVFATLRQSCDLTYDALMDLANEHDTIRSFLGCSIVIKNDRFSRSCINDNVNFVTPKTWDKINDLILLELNALSPDAIKHLRADTFVIETNTHYPSDSRQLCDVLSRMLGRASFLSKTYDCVKKWRQSKKLQSNLPTFLKSIRTAFRSRAKNRKEILKKSYDNLFDLSDTVLERMSETLSVLDACEQDNPNEFKEYASIAEEMHWDLCAIETVVRQAKGSLSGDHIPNEEKIFSIYEPHAELINRGKYPQPLQMGKKVLIIADKEGNIVYKEKMERGVTDDKPLITAVKHLQEKYNYQIEIVSADRGFHTVSNQKELQEIINTPCIASKGKSKKWRLDSKEYQDAIRNHSIIESSINELQHTGLKRCFDKTEEGFDKNLSKGILVRNLILFGKKIIRQEYPKAQAAFTKRKIA